MEVYIMTASNSAMVTYISGCLNPYNVNDWHGTKIILYLIFP